MKKNKSGFTLIELIIVVTIVGILAIVAIPKYFTNINRSRKAAALSNLRSVRDAINAYYAQSGAEYGAAAAGETINVVIDGETVMSVKVPATCSATATDVSCNVTGGTCTYTMNIASGDISHDSGADCL